MLRAEHSAVRLVCRWFSSPAKDIIERRMKEKSILRRTQQLTKQDSQQAANLQDYLYQDVPFDFKLLAPLESLPAKRLEVVLRLHQIYFTRIHSELYLSRMKHLFKDLRKVDQAKRWPMLLIGYNLAQPQYRLGEQEILAYFTKDYIKTYQHLSHSGWAQQGVEFVRTKVEPPLTALFWNPVLATQSLKLHDPGTVPHHWDILTLVCYKMIGFAKRVVSNNWDILKNKERYARAKGELEEGLREWAHRVTGRAFHGGEQPDEADVEMYALLLTRTGTSSFEEWLHGTAVKEWKLRMDRACSYRVEQ